MLIIYYKMRISKMQIIKKNKEKYINTLKKMYKGGGNNKTKQENYSLE